jgi:hypothetical protein
MLLLRKDSYYLVGKYFLFDFRLVILSVFTGVVIAVVSEVIIGGL